MDLFFYKTDWFISLYRLCLALHMFILAKMFVFSPRLVYYISSCVLLDLDMWNCTALSIIFRGARAFEVKKKFEAQSYFRLGTPPITIVGGKISAESTCLLIQFQALRTTWDRIGFSMVKITFPQIPRINI